MLIKTDGKQNPGGMVLVSRIAIAILKLNSEGVTLARQ